MGQIVALTEAGLNEHGYVDVCTYSISKDFYYIAQGLRAEVQGQGLLWGVGGNSPGLQREPRLEVLQRFG